MRISKFRRNKRRPGFTLLEVMITVAIVGILASIALPMYYEQVMRSKIIDGTTKLLDFKGKIDGYFRDNRTYQAGAVCGVADPLVSPADYFQINCTAPSATTYVITATGIAAKGMSGFVYRIDQTNAKATPTVPAGWTSSGVCWVLRKDGSC
jgi:type IV pilus assembly protein PilE